MKNKTLIYQVKLNLNNTISNLYEWCTGSVKEYAKRIGSDYICQKDPTLNILPKNRKESNRSDNVHKLGLLPIFEKENAFTYLKDYDSVCIIDADIFVRPNSPNIFENQLSEDYSFGGVLECEMPITEKYRQKILAYSKGQYTSLAPKIKGWNWDSRFGFPFWNMGLMLMNKSFETYLNGMTPKEFLEQEQFKGFVDGKEHWKWSTDQTLLNYWIRKEQMKTKNLDWRFNALYRGVEESKIKSAHFVHFFLKDHLPNRGENIRELSKLIGETI